MTVASLCTLTTRSSNQVYYQQFYMNALSPTSLNQSLSEQAERLLPEWEFQNKVSSGKLKMEVFTLFINQVISVQIDVMWWRWG